MDTGGIDINALIDGSRIVLDKQDDGESILELHVTKAADESTQSYEYDEYQQITGTLLNNAGHITITIENQDQFCMYTTVTRYADTNLVTLANNGLLYLFSSMKLTLGWTDGGTCQLSWTCVVNLYKSIVANNVIPVSFHMGQCETFLSSSSKKMAIRC